MTPDRRRMARPFKPAATMLVVAAGFSSASASVAAQDDAPRRVADEGAAIQPVVDPDARRIVERAIEAIGGRARIDSIRISTSVHAMRVGEREVRAQVVRSRDGRFIARQSITGMGEMELGWTGSHGWIRDPREARVTLVPRRAVGELIDSIDLQSFVRELDVRFRTHRSEGPSERAGRSCDRVRMTDAAKREVLVDFDRETGLPAAMEVVGGGPSERRVVEFIDWTEPRPLRTFRRARIIEGDRTTDAEWLAVTFDDVDDAALAPPSEVVRLVREQERAQAKTTEGPETE